MVVNIVNWLLENSEHNTWISLKNFSGQALGISTHQMQIPRKFFETSEIIQPSSMPLMVAILSWLPELVQGSGILPHLLSFW